MTSRFHAFSRNVLDHVRNAIDGTSRTLLCHLFPLVLIPSCDVQKPRITEIHVRMDCNGCVQKIKRALHGINGGGRERDQMTVLLSLSLCSHSNVWFFRHVAGIYDLYIDFPNQKLTIIGWADPEKIVKAIKKTRKTATICSHTEQPDPAALPPEQPPDGDAPPSDAANTPQQEALPPEPPKDTPVPENPPPAPEHPNSQPEPNKREGQTPQDGQPPPTPPAGQPPSGPKDAGEVHVVYHHPPPPEYGYRYWYVLNLATLPHKTITIIELTVFLYLHKLFLDIIIEEFKEK